MNFNIDITTDIENYFMLLPVALAMFVFILACLKRANDLYLRVGVLLLITIFLLNHVIVKEIREYLDSKIVVVLDNSESMKLLDRGEIAKKIVSNLEKDNKNNEVILINAGGKESNLFSVLKNSLITLPLSRIAGTVFVTDGQISDVPKEVESLKSIAPINAVIVGHRDEFDYKVSIEQSPKYGMIGDKFNVVVKADVEGKIDNYHKNV